MSWLAAIDLGSVMTELLLTDGRQRVRRSVDTLLGSTPRADADRALGRLGAALDGFRPLIEDRRAEVVVVATGAARGGIEAGRLATVVGDRLGVEPEVLEPADEARLGFLGAVSGGSPSRSRDTVATVDLGGSSTEFAVGTEAGPEALFSLPIGGSVLTATYLDHDPPAAEELSAGLSVVELHADDLVRERPAIAAALGSGTTTVYGLGAIVTVAAVEVGLLDQDPLNGDGDGPLHGQVLTKAGVEDVFRTVATESRADRAHNPGLPASRVDTIVGGCAVLVELMRRLGIDQVVVSQRGVTDGVVARRG